MLRDAGQRPYAGIDILRGADNQLRALIDVCHVHGIAVIFDVVYNHAGGGFDDHSMWFFDRAPNGNMNKASISPIRDGPADWSSRIGTTT